MLVDRDIGGLALDGAFEGLAGFRATFPVTSVELYHHDPDGVWRVVRSFPLAGS